MPEILIIEDERPIAELLKYSLEREGYAVRMAHTGADGLAEIEAALPDLVLLDLMLPDMDGLDICRQVTQQRKDHRAGIWGGRLYHKAVRYSGSVAADAVGFAPGRGGFSRAWFGRYFKAGGSLPDSQQA